MVNLKEMRIFYLTSFIIIFLCFSSWAVEYNLGFRYSKSSNTDYDNILNADVLNMKTENYKGVLGLIVNNNIEMNLLVGNIESEISPERGLYKLKLNKNLYAGAEFSSNMDLCKNLKLNFNMAYLNTLKKDYEINGVKINNFEIKDFSSFVGLKKEFLNADIYTGIGYIDRIVKSGADSTTGYMYKLKIKNNLAGKAEFAFHISNSVKFSLGCIFNDYTEFTAGLNYKFKSLLSKTRAQSTAVSEKNESQLLPAEKVLTKEGTEQETAKEVEKEETENLKNLRMSEPETMSSDSYEEYKSKGMRNFQLENYSEALKYYNMAKELKPNAVEIYQYLGDTYEKMGNYKEALENYDMAIKLMENRQN